jgi:hypothetical protein
MLTTGKCPQPKRAPFGVMPGDAGSTGAARLSPLLPPLPLLLLLPLLLVPPLLLLLVVVVGMNETPVPL